jgi:hypothetical protein
MRIVELIIVGRWGRLGVKNVATYSAARAGQANWQNTSPPEGVLNYGLERLQKIPDLRNLQLKLVESMILSKHHRGDLLEKRGLVLKVLASRLYLMPLCAQVLRF